MRSTEVSIEEGRTRTRVPGRPEPPTTVPENPRNGLSMSMQSALGSSLLRGCSPRAIEGWSGEGVAVHALVERRNRHRPAGAAWFSNKGTVRAGGTLHGLFEQAVEEHVITMPISCGSRHASSGFHL